MIKKNFLEEFKGKVIGVEAPCFARGQNLLLLDYDDHFLYFENYGRERFYLSIFNLLNFSPPTKEDTDKFYNYRKKFDEDPDFEGDDTDKGFHVIKRIKRIK